MHYYVITLERTPERLIEFEVNNPNFVFDKFLAVDGEKLVRNELIEDGLITETITNRYTDGALGVALSHKTLWEKCVELNEPITVIEDDAYINKNFKRIVETTTKIDDGWDFIFWGSNLDQNVEISILPGLMFSSIKSLLNLKNINTILNYEITPSFYRCIFAVGLVSYSITPSCAKYMLQKCFPLNDPEHKQYLNFGVDHSVLEQLPFIHAYYCFPPLVLTKNDQLNSTVQK
jgi:GR25 family glycosyltransferase involved in LPS biosynthesis